MLLKINYIYFNSQIIPPDSRENIPLSSSNVKNVFFVYFSKISLHLVQNIRVCVCKENVCEMLCVEFSFS